MNWTAEGSKVTTLYLTGPGRPTPKEAAKAFREEHGFAPDGVESDDEHLHVVGICEACDVAIFEGEPYGSDPDGGVFVCAPCAASEERMVEFALKVTVMAHAGEADEAVRRHLVRNVYEIGDVEDVEVAE